LCGGYDAPILVRVYDHDDDGTHDFIGEAKTSLRQLCASNMRLVLINRVKKQQGSYVNSGILHVRQAVPEQITNDSPPTRVTLTFKGKNLTSKDLMGVSDPYVQIRNAANTLVYKSNHIENDANPSWAPFDLKVADCLGMDKTLTIQVYDHDEHTNDDLIGECSMSLRHLSFYKKNPEWRLYDPRKKDSIGYKNSGFLIIKGYEPHFDQVNPAQPGFGANPMPTFGIQPAFAIQPGFQPPVQPSYGAQPGYPGTRTADVQSPYGAQPAYVAPQPSYSDPTPGFSAQPAYPYANPNTVPAYVAQPGVQPAYSVPQPSYSDPTSGFSAQPAYPYTNPNSAPTTNDIYKF